MNPKGPCSAQQFSPEATEVSTKVNTTRVSGVTYLSLPSNAFSELMDLRIVLGDTLVSVSGNLNMQADEVGDDSIDEIDLIQEAMRQGGKTVRMKRYLDDVLDTFACPSSYLLQCFQGRLNQAKFKCGHLRRSSLGEGAGFASQSSRRL